MRPDLSFLRSFFLTAAFAAPASGNCHELGFAKYTHQGDQFISREDLIFDPQLAKEECNLLLLGRTFELVGLLQCRPDHVGTGGIRSRCVSEMCFPDRCQNLHQIFDDCGAEEVILRQLSGLHGLHIDVIGICAFIHHLETGGRDSGEVSEADQQADCQLTMVFLRRYRR